MDDLRTGRLLIHAVDAAEAERIRDRRPAPSDQWAPDFPFRGDIDALTMMLRATEEYGEQRPFGYYRITRLSDSMTIGGIGFHGPPTNGRAEVGYGLAESARGHGYAAEALIALVRWAGELGLSQLVAETTVDNVASQRTLVRAGFHRTDNSHHPDRSHHSDGAADTLHFARTVGSHPSR